jgi:hypothetical protein
MKHKSTNHFEPVLMLVCLGLGLGLFLTGMCWVVPGSAGILFGTAPVFRLMLLTAAVLVLSGAVFAGRGGLLAISRPLLLLGIFAATAVVYLFPEWFAPGCGGIPRVLAACPNSCLVYTCNHWVPKGGTLPNGNTCDPPHSWDIGCCTSYTTSCDPSCSEEDPDPRPTATPIPTSTPTPVPQQPPTVSGSVTCALAGSNPLTGAGGWCREGAALNLTAGDPQGYTTTITGDIAGAPFTCVGPSCTQNLPAGSGTIHFKATAATSGLYSVVGSASFAYDPNPPTMTLSASGTPGSNGWYSSPVSLSIGAADATSGVAVIEYRLDGGSWVAGSSLTLADGEHSLEARATDNAGNTSAVTTSTTISVRVDTTEPTLSTAISGTLGHNNWYVSDVTVTATASDAGSGLALIEYRLDGGDWTAGSSVTVPADGPHTVDFRVTDMAGNQADESRSIKIDQTRPVSVFISPPQTMDETIATGPFPLRGRAEDATSGLASVQISTDNGATWTDLTPDIAGGWSHVWDTGPLPNGRYPVMVQAEDLAGNREDSARVTLLLANQLPKVSIQDSWWIWEAGSFSVQERQIPITEIRVRITCLDGQPDVKLSFPPGEVPSELRWDRKCGEGQFATSGDHPVTLTACDGLGRCASAEGVIKVPFLAPPIPTFTPTVAPTATAIPRRTQSPKTPLPTPTMPAPLVVETPAPDPIPQPEPLPAWRWAALGFAGILAALAAASLADPRPGALRRLGRAFDEVRDGAK